MRVGFPSGPRKNTFSIPTFTGKLRGSGGHATGGRYDAHVLRDLERQVPARPCHHPSCAAAAAAAAAVLLPPLPLPSSCCQLSTRTRTRFSSLPCITDKWSSTAGKLMGSFRFGFSKRRILMTTAVYQFDWLDKNQIPFVLKTTDAT